MGSDVRFEWDVARAESNLRKHGVAFELAMRVFADPMHLSEQDRIEGEEYRWRTIGMVGAYRLVVVAHTWCDDHGDEVIRIISARLASAAERRRYEQ